MLIREQLEDEKPDDVQVNFELYGKGGKFGGIDEVAEDR